MLQSEYVILHNDVHIKQTGNRFFLIRESIDYSKEQLIQLTDLGVSLIEYIRTRKSFDEICTKFPQATNIELEKYLKYLEEKNYISLWTNKIKDDAVLLRNLIKGEWTESRVPFGFTFELTSRCNFRCIHCYLDDCHETKDLSFDEVKYIIDFMSDAGMMVIFLSGGEPLLRNDFKDIYLYAKKRGFLVEIFTNGYLIDDELISLFRSYPPLEIDISLYGSSNEMYEKVTGIKNAFTTIKSNIEKCIDAGIYVSTKTPVLAVMENDLDNMKSFTEQNKIPWRISFNIVPTVKNVPKDSQQLDAHKAALLYKKYSKSYIGTKETLLAALSGEKKLANNRYACKMGRTSCFVTYDGIVAPCIETRHRGISLFGKKFQDIWNHIGNITYEELSEKDVSEYKCLNCNLVSICKSCPAVRERFYGNSTDVKESDCSYAKTLYDLILSDI